MATREDESISGNPSWVTWIMAHMMLKEQVCRWCESHRSAGMTIARALNCIGRERSRVNDGAIIHRRPLRGQLWRECGGGFIGHAMTLSNG